MSLRSGYAELCEKYDDAIQFKFSSKKIQTIVAFANWFFKLFLLIVLKALELEQCASFCN